VQTASPLVLKLGGSLEETGRIADILTQIQTAKRPLILVPGGGPFADEVRRAQSTQNLSNEAAHRFALLAMHRMAELWIARAPRLTPAETIPEIRRALAAHRIPIWLPFRLAANDAFIPRDWSITSDGLAARLAERIGQAQVVLVKSCPVPRHATLKTLARLGITDQAFPAIVSRARLTWRVLGAGDDQQLQNLLSGSRSTARHQHAIAPSL
jgi:5-(aminomethyl)-3-furanmethanol phosphate kinase